MSTTTTTIEWTDATWNPVSGCSHVSEGCRNCYAEVIAKRFSSKNSFPEFKPWSAQNAAHNVALHPERLDQPLRWKKPRRIFVNSMSDLFHEAIPDHFIDSCFMRMNHAKQHTFQILTKRPQRMKQYILSHHRPPFFIGYNDWKHIWLGVSVEDQKTADERIPLLLQTPAPVRFVSYEPALGPVDFDLWVRASVSSIDYFQRVGPDRIGQKETVDWMIIGGESGPKARPCNIEWIRSAVNQCKAAGVPVFVKQLGSRPYKWHQTHRQFDSVAKSPLKSRKGGDPGEWPEDLRVREFPK